VAIPHVKAVTATNIAQYYEEDTIGARSHGVTKQNNYTTWMSAACLLKKKTVHKTGNNTWITALMDSNMEKSPTM